MKSSLLSRRVVHLATVAVLLGCWVVAQADSAEPVQGLTEVFRANGRWGAATCGDLDGSGDLRVLRARRSRPGAVIFVYDLQGAIVDRWPDEREAIWSIGLLQADEDKEMEVLTVGKAPDWPYEMLMVHESDGTVVGRRTFEHGTPPVIADVDGDGKDEILRVNFDESGSSTRLSLQLLSADLAVRWSREGPQWAPGCATRWKPEIGVGDLDGDGPAELVVRPLRPGPDLLSVPLHFFLVLDGDGKLLRKPQWQGVGDHRYAGLLGVADFLRESPGAEILMVARRARDHRLGVLNGQGQELLSIYPRRVDDDMLAVADDALAVGRWLAVANASGNFFVFDEQGEKVAHVKGRNIELLTGAVDRSGRPVFLVGEGPSVVVYALEEK